MNELKTISTMDTLDETAKDWEQPPKTPKKRKKSVSKGNKNGKKNKRKIFKPSAIWFKEKEAWNQYIKQHKRDLKKTTPKVDDKAPALEIATIYDIETFKGVRLSLNYNYLMNQTMVKNLHLVNITPGKTETFAHVYGKPKSNNHAMRREDAKMIEKKNAEMLNVIKNARTNMITAKEYAEMWRKHEAVMESNASFPLFWKVKSTKQSPIEVSPPVPTFRQFTTEKSAKYADKRPRVFLEVAIKNVGVVGKMVVMLYSDYVPMTVKNFLAFCDPKAPLTYKGNLFYLIFQNFYCQTGDVVENRGYGGTSIYGPYFKNEDFTLKHGERGVLTTYQNIPNRNGSQFLITFRKLQSLDGQNVVFGKVIKGLHILDTIEGVGCKKTGRPRVGIYISDCDEI